MIATDMERICIAVVTYRRPELLARSLDALQVLELPPGTQVDVLVVDNDPQRSAWPIVERYASHPLAVRYATEPARGIPQARNRALAEAASYDMLAFIDDDDLADPYWLLALHATLKQSAADIVRGQVIYRFPEGRQYLAQTDLFAPLSHATGAVVDSAWTGNVLMRTACYNHGRQFDLRFRRGGSDHHFFHSLHRQGARIVFCREALVYSDVPPERCTPRWLLRRSMRVGAALTRTDRYSLSWRRSITNAFAAAYGSTLYARRLGRGIRSGVVPAIHPAMALAFAAGRLWGITILPRWGERI